MGIKNYTTIRKQSSGKLNKLLFSKKAFNSNKQQDSVEEGVSSSCTHARLFFFFSFQKHAWQHCFSAFLKDRRLSWTGGYAVLMNCRLFNKNIKCTASRIQRLWRTSGGLYNFPGKAVGALGQNPYVFHVVAHLGRCTTDMLIMLSHTFIAYECTFRKYRNRECIKHRQV